MKHLAFPLALLLGLAWAPPARAQTSSDGERFDVQAFRPTGNPYDLMMVRQATPMPVGEDVSEENGKKIRTQRLVSVSGGLVLDFALDPLVLIRQDSQSRLLSVVGNRLTLDAVATIGLLDWVELGIAMPLVLMQTSDNLESLGTEGPIQSLAQGDLRLDTKIAIPGLRRKLTDHGFGAALTFGLTLPTGNRDAFASDGALTIAPGAVLDYRFESGVLLAVNAGYWSRPVREFNGLKLGPMDTLGAAAEVPIVPFWNISAVGELYGSYSNLTQYDGKHAFPAEALIALRWYSPSGLTFTVGGGGGCGCSFSAPTLRLFASVMWEPHKTDDYKNRFKEPPPPPPPDPDPDHDGIIGERDKCPDKAGPVENSGCPDTDKDGDGVVDRLDKCPDIAQRTGHDGCPLARLEGNKIVILDQVHFFTDQDIIKNESFPILDDVVRVMTENPDIDRVRVEGHTDSRADKKYNLDLSRRRAASVSQYLIEHGVSPKRLWSQGFGSERRLVNDDDRNEQAMALNRRVEFNIERRVANRPPDAPANAPDKGVWAERFQKQLEELKKVQASLRGELAQRARDVQAELENLLKQGSALAQDGGKELQARGEDVLKRAGELVKLATDKPAPAKGTVNQVMPASDKSGGKAAVVNAKGTVQDAKLDNKAPTDPVERKRWRLTPRPLQSPAAPAADAVAK